MKRGLIRSSSILLLTIFGRQLQEVSSFCSSRTHATFLPETSKFTSTDDANFFDPFLHSPHDYPDGVDSGPDVQPAPNGLESIDEIFERSASLGFSSEPSSPLLVESSPPQSNNNNIGDLFDPLLSPHAYPDGTDAGPVTETTSQSLQAAKKLGILLIDHGSKREASNQHLQFIAETYEASIIQRDASFNSGDEGISATMGGDTVVRAAHMEIAEPSILTSLRNIITINKATEIVCVPYFLSPGKHSTVDVPNLIAEAKQVLGEEGLLQDGSINIFSSQALGTQLEFMLGAVDELVGLALKDGE